MKRLIRRSAVGIAATALLMSPQAIAAVPDSGVHPSARHSVSAPPVRGHVPYGHQASPGMSVGVVADSAAKGGRVALAAEALPGGHRLMQARAKALDLHPCRSDDSFLCGRLQVPLDRTGSGTPGTTGIHVQVAPHTGKISTPKGAIFATSGGPGNSITGSNGEMYPFRDYVLAPLTKHYDLVFIDQRGVGLSGAINCPRWQHHQPSYAAARQCFRSLGQRRNFYSTAAVADDIDAVRSALGYDKIVVMGGSYAGNDMVSYAVRHRDHVAAVVVGSPYIPVGADGFGSSTPKAIPAVVNRLCRRSVACRHETPNPSGQLAWLVQRLRNHPVTGVGYDYAGNPHHVEVTEGLLVRNILTSDQFPFLGQGEIAQAAVALKHGDDVPLLRLAAEALRGPGFFDSGNPRDFSAGDNIVRYCLDNNFPWDETAPLSVRRVQYDQAFADQPARYGLFSKEAWAAPLPESFFPDPCIMARWKTDLPYAPGTRVGGIPTLVLTGDLDLVVPTYDSRRAANVLTDSTLITVKNAAHNPWWWRECVPHIVQRFIRTGQADDLCANTPLAPLWEIGSFPKSVEQLPPARRRAGDHSQVGDRRLATDAVWAVLDVIHRQYAGRSGTGVGLRGGTTSLDFGDYPTPDVFHLHHVRFTEDVVVDGTGFSDWFGKYGGDVTVREDDGTRGTLHFEGLWYGPDASVFTIRGTVDGRTIRLTVPAR